MIPLNYHHLYYFWVTAKSGSISAARERLLLAQPTLSLQIGELERFFGMKLLVRTRRGVTLTPEGRVAFEYCERIFTQGDALVASLKEGRNALPPPLRLGVHHSINREIVLKILDAARAAEPRVQVSVFTGGAADVAERLSRYALDLAVADSDFSAMLGRDFRSRLAAALPVRLVAAPRLRRQLKRFPTPGLAVPVLLRTPENPVRKDVEQYLRRLGVHLIPAAETEDSDLIRILAIQGRGIAALTALAVSGDLRDGSLQVLDTKPSGLKEDVRFLSGINPHPDAAVQKVLHTLMNDFRIAS